jgi:hypothetical protein
VTIQNWATGELLWTIKFNEWTPNNSDLDLRVQHTTPLDDRYIYGSFDGTIFGVDKDENPSGERKPRFTAKVDTPVFRVFDVLSHVSKKELVVLPQPPIEREDYASDHLVKTYIGTTGDGAWYALPEESFPHVTDNAEGAPCYQDAKDWHTLPQHQRQLALIGTHKVLNNPQRNIGYYDKQKIAGSEGTYSQPNRKYISSKAAYPTDETDLANVNDPVWSIGRFPASWLLVLVVAGYLFVHKPGVPRPIQDLKLDGESMVLPAAEVLQKQADLVELDAEGKPVASSSTEKDEKTTVEIVQAPTSETPAESTESQGTTSEPIEAEVKPAQPPTDTRATTPDSVVDSVNGSSRAPTVSSVSEAGEDAGVVAAVPATPDAVPQKPPAIPEPSPIELGIAAEVTKTRTVVFHDPKDELPESDIQLPKPEANGHVSSEEDGSAPQPAEEETPKKKKYARGRRGGKKKKKKDPAVEAPPAVEEPEEEVDLAASVELSPSETKVVIHDPSETLGADWSNQVDMNRHRNYVPNNLEVFEGELIGKIMVIPLASQTNNSSRVGFPRNYGPQRPLGRKGSGGKTTSYGTPRSRHEGGQSSSGGRLPRKYRPILLLAEAGQFLLHCTRVLPLLITRVHHDYNRTRTYTPAI